MTRSVTEENTVVSPVQRETKTTHTHTQNIRKRKIYTCVATNTAAVTLPPAKAEALGRIESWVVSARIADGREAELAGLFSPSSISLVTVDPPQVAAVVSAALSSNLLRLG